MTDWRFLFVIEVIFISWASYRFGRTLGKSFGNDENNWFISSLLIAVPMHFFQPHIVQHVARHRWYNNRGGLFRHSLQRVHRFDRSWLNGRVPQYVYRNKATYSGYPKHINVVKQLCNCLHVHICRASLLIQSFDCKNIILSYWIYLIKNSPVWQFQMQRLSDLSPPCIRVRYNI